MRFFSLFGYLTGPMKQEDSIEKMTNNLFHGIRIREVLVNSTYNVFLPTVAARRSDNPFLPP